MPRSPSYFVFHILLALTNRERHGLGIADWIAATTEGELEIGPGTLYRSLKEMVEAGLIREAAAPEPESDPRRRYYAITAAGLRAAREEAERLERIVGVARAHRLLARRA